jgi:hypothetical protein
MNLRDCRTYRENAGNRGLFSVNPPHSWRASHSPCSSFTISSCILSFSSRRDVARFAMSFIAFSPALSYSSSDFFASPSLSRSAASLAPCEALKFFNAETNSAGGGCAWVCILPSWSVAVYREWRKTAYHTPSLQTKDCSFSVQILCFRFGCASNRAMHRLLEYPNAGFKNKTMGCKHLICCIRKLNSSSCQF